MPVDASIYGQIQQPQQPNPLNALAQSLQIRGLQSQLDRGDRETAQQNKLADLYRSSVGQDGTINRQQLLTGAASSGLGTQIPALQKGFSEQDKSSREAEKAMLEQQLKKFELSGQIMNGVQDQASWDRARQQTAQVFGPEAAAKLPPEYNPALIQENMAKAMSVKDQLEQKYKMLTFGETQRHNSATEALTNQGQMVSRANNADTIANSAQTAQMTDARSREFNATRVEENRLKREAQGSGTKLTEDQGKATGWLVQAENAFKNMQAAGFDKDGNPTSAAKPGFNDALEGVPGIGGVANALRSPERQKFMQASSSLSESLLRAATGAGVNESEAKQKIQELTPRFGENNETTKQKMAAIPLYIDSLKVRAGPGAAKAEEISTNNAPKNSGVMAVTDAASYAKVPSGATYTTPDGKTRRKP